MLYLGGLIQNQAQRLLQSPRSAVLYAVLLAISPYTTWVSVAIIALVTLRKGWQSGGLLLAYAATAYFSLAFASSTSVSISLMNAVLTFIPCYLAACVLSMTASWRAVAYVYLLQVALIVLILQWFLPEYIMAQFTFVMNVLRDMNTDGALKNLMTDNPSIHQNVIACYLLGLQAVGVMLSATMSLMLARSVQSQLFYPGGFRQEMLSFRGDKLGFMLLTVMFIAARQQYEFAMCFLPMITCFFLLAGLSLSFKALPKQRSFGLFVFTIITVVFLPFIMLPAYVIFGSIDSLFNLRLYLPSEAGKTI